MTLQWHGSHLCHVEGHIEIERLGSIAAEPVDPPMAYVAAGTRHLPRVCNTFAEGMDYLEGPPNRAPVERSIWDGELYQ